MGKLQTQAVSEKKEMKHKLREWRNKELHNNSWRPLGRTIQKMNKETGLHEQCETKPNQTTVIFDVPVEYHPLSLSHFVHPSVW